ncbi:MAG: hypothetical protein RJS97_02960, partial [Parvibaculaceae bacterium]
GPGFIRRGLNFFKAASRHVADGMQLLEEDQVEARLNVCRSCDHCDTDKMVCLRPECGCFLKVKARWRSEECPLGKWEKVSISDETNTE